MKHFDLKAYYRPEATMAKMLGERLYATGEIKSHRFQVAMLANADTLAFAANNPDALVVNLGYEELTGRVPEFGNGAPCQYVIVGVSLKEVTLENFKYLTHWRSKFSIADIDLEYKNSVSTPTDNPNIFIINDRYVWNAKPEVVVENYTDVEKQWIKLWDGFDHYYSYTDDHSVWKRWDTRHKEIYAEGTSLGISKSRMDVIFKKCVKN